jgi:Holliday junction resolvase-like predicted endonuclease
MNKVAKGSRIELMAKKELQANGYRRTTKATRTRFNKIDILDLFDLIALADDGSEIRLIQVKSNKCDKKVIAEIAALKVPDSVRKELWVWHDRAGWEKWRWYQSCNAWSQPMEG